MKIAYILYPEVVVSNRSNGIRSQAETWAKLLQAEGHEVVLVNNWGDYIWTDFDIIHLFGGGKWIYRISKRLSAINQKLVWSPIIDPKIQTGHYCRLKIERFLHKISFDKYQWAFYDAFKSKSYIKMVLCRSKFEQQYISTVLDIPEEKSYIVPLSYSSTCKPYVACEKEPFCLHISSIYQKRKNVLRLIEAAKKFNFKLVLAGNCGSEEQFLPIKKAINNNSNIKVLGYISEEDKRELYKRAKVFALPSISEGVGIVALDAAYYGCEIAITAISGPKEYYNGNCIEVNPYDINSIGMAIKKLLDGEVAYQPILSEVIQNDYSPNTIVKTLVNAYTNIAN